MKTTYKIDACHPIFKRVIQSNLDEAAMEKLKNELLSAGYEDKDILVETTKIVLQDGDMVEVTPEMFFVLPDDPDKELEVATIADRKLAECKKSLKYIYGENPQAIIGSLYAHRLGRDHGQLCVKWHNAKNEDWQHTNVYFLEALGFEFEQPEFDEIPLEECDDDLLGDTERVYKYLLIQNPSHTEASIDKYMEPLHKAMKEAGCVFYRP